MTLIGGLCFNRVLTCTGDVWVLSSTSSVLLTTRSPEYTVSLGTGDTLHAKLRSMLLVREKLMEMGKNAGSINVSNPETPFYSPSSPQ